MPAVDFGVGLKREDVSGQVRRKRLGGLGVLEFPVLDRMLQEGNVLLGTEEDLERLPAREASGRQGGYARGFEVVPGRL